MQKKRLQNTHNITDWLPTTAKEVKAHGWDKLDVILFSGDAYIDHPSFGSAVIGRVLTNMGLRVAIVPQPNWQDDLRDFKKLGPPRLFFGVTAGNMDSMVNHYTAGKRLRSNDAYTPGGKSGFRPDYATVVYTDILKTLFPDIPVILGGIEASLRRFTHFDYWKNELKPNILSWSRADLLVYGMAEKPLRDLVTLLQKGVPPESLNTLPQTAILQDKDAPLPKNKKWEDIELFSHEECLADKTNFARNFKHIEEESNRMYPARLHQVCGDKRIIVNPALPPLKENEIDYAFDLPYTRLPHPRYHNKGAIPAYDMIKHSVNLHRGCFGGCSFCTISAHQGKFISSRSEKSILKEVKQIANVEDFKGNISDLGGPSANMYKMQGKVLSICEKCKRPSCIFPAVCKNLNTSHRPLTEIYKKADKIPGIKRTYIGSGVRYDMLLNQDATEQEKKTHEEYLKELLTKHVSGRLKVAPEHPSHKVLNTMRKPSFSLFKKFTQQFQKINKEASLNQQIIPYFISSHPVCEERDMALLAAETKSLNFNLEQVQDFTPTPMTLATVMYYTGLDPYTLKKVYVARNKEEKQNQRQFFFWYKPEMRQQLESKMKRLGWFDVLKILFPEKASGNSQKTKDDGFKSRERSGKRKKRH
ncbi:YgiQ family radical SAM protein [Marinilabilia sp.]|uniref:YgiQ family radical SAM protein n=1 Tax=Marinilabilia sp. TaxID=2021252 RepID=UPI0025BDB897|nr:YgiQ family radical SAM protein [Marinilabilia sp.]